ncbi:MAG: M20/M25/M40 family metallo-hydrolase [Myxococcota bacterium]
MSLRPSARHLRDYVAIPSVNPMGRDDIPSAIRGERRYAEHLREQLRALGLDAELVGGGDRPSVVAEARSDRARETVLVASHLDTVPVDGMEIDPFDPRVEDGRLYGRGSCDTKGGMAALVAALEQVLASRRLGRNLIVVGEADEEYGSLGVQDVLAGLGGRRPDWVLATEPTELRLVTHHKGIALVRLAARGRAGHSSDPAAGSNAIVALSRAVLALEELRGELATRKDPRLGPATLSVGRIGGGLAPNIVPDAAWLVMDRRLLPGEDAAGVRKEVEAALLERNVGSVGLEHCEVAKGPLDTPDDHPSVRACQSALQAAGLPTAPCGVAFGTDAGGFAEAGLPGVVLGPGSIRQAHTTREFVELDQLDAMTEFFVHLLEGRS